MKKTSLIIVVPGLKGIDNVGTFDQDVFSGVVNLRLNYLRLITRIQR